MSYETLPAEVLKCQCEKYGCGTYSWGRNREIFLAHTSFQGSSLVKMTRAGLWACQKHAIEVGNGWIEN